MRLIQLILLLGLLGFVGCSSDVEEEIYPSIECQTEDMSYVADILPIIETDCFNCHDAANNFGGVTLEGFEAVKIFADNGQLVGSIRHEAGFSFMPQGAPQLLTCEIEKIEAWIDQGTKDN